MMDIIIVGAGKVGCALAYELSKLKHNITVVDTNEQVLDTVSNHIDVNCIHGSGVNMEILLEAGAETADLILSVTGNDELNIISSVIAARLGVKNTVVRVRSPEYTGEIALLKQGLGISRIINPEHEAAVEISLLLSLPVANKIDAFANGRVQLVEYTAEKSDSITGKSLQDVNLPKNFLICGVKNSNDDFIIPTGSFVVRPGDTLYLSGTLISLNNFFKSIGHTSKRAKNIMIIGGSRMAIYLARMACKTGINVKLIERNAERSLHLTELLEDCLIIRGDGTDEEILLSEDLKKMDAFIALTDSDEENLLSAFYAKKQGVSKVIPKLNRQSYLDLTEELKIESSVCPSLITADHMFRYVKALDNTKSDAMKKLYRVADGEAEAIEFIASENSRVIGIPLKTLTIKKNLLVAAIVHEKEVIIPSGQSVIHPGDQVLIFSRHVHLTVLDDIINPLI